MVLLIFHMCQVYVHICGFVCVVGTDMSARIVFIGCNSCVCSFRLKSLHLQLQLIFTYGWKGVCDAVHVYMDGGLSAYSIIIFICRINLLFIRLITLWYGDVLYIFVCFGRFPSGVRIYSAHAIYVLSQVANTWPPTRNSFVC